MEAGNEMKSLNLFWTSIELRYCRKSNDAQVCSILFKDTLPIGSLLR